MKKSLLFAATAILAPAAAFAQATFGTPKAPERIEITCDPTTGMATYWWTPVTEDTDGNPIPAENIGYIVYDTNGKQMFNIRTNTYTRREFSPGIKHETIISIKTCAGDLDDSKSTKKYSALVKGETYILGDVETLPVVESFTSSLADLPEGLWTSGVPTSNQAFWALSSQNKWEGVSAQDDDEGYTTFLSGTSRGPGSLVSNWIDLDGAKHPMFTMYKLNRGEKDSNVTEVSVRTKDGEYKSMLKFGEAAKEQVWERFDILLDEFAGKTVKIKIEPKQGPVPTFIFDNFNVYDNVGTNLAAKRLRVSKNLWQGVSYTVRADIHNVGASDVAAYRATLFRNGKPVQTVNGKELKSLHSQALTFDETVPACEGTTLEYYVEVEADGDAIDRDNRTATITASVHAPARPEAENLSATAGQDVALSWSTPSVVSNPQGKEVTEGFDDLTLFEFGNNVGGWQSVDGDGSTAPFSVTDVNFPNMLAPKAFMVLGNDVHGLYPTVKARSGANYMAAIGTYATNKAADDWLVSPRLHAGGQKVSFHARSVIAKKTCPVEVCYSSGSRDTKDFVSVQKFTVAADIDWQKFETNLPEDAKYFAIHMGGTAIQTMLCIDDVTYTPEVQDDDLSIEGYNVYCNGVRVNTDLITMPSFTHKNAGDGKKTYVVTTVYNKGESLGSAPLNITAGVESAIAGTITVASREAYTLDGRAINKPAPGQLYLEVSTLTDGRKVTEKKICR